MNATKLLFSLLHPLEIIKHFTLWGDSGGGGSSTGGGVQIQELPEWARPYAKSALEKGAALSEKPYQTYDQARIAGFSPLQQQAQQGAANMQTSGATGAGIDVAGAAALGGLNQNYQGIQAGAQNFGGNQAAQYMSPFAMQALQPTLNEQARQSQLQQQQNAAQAVGRGAFGGSRDALVQAENQRNLGILQGNTVAQGMQNAYTNAQQQFNADQARQLQAQGMNIGQQQFGANLGLQGLNTALQGAGQLGALGQQQFQQGMDINKLQSAYGGQQQALQQQGLTQAYEDFQNQQNYPYKQLGFFSDLIRGLPLGQQTTKTMYEPNPTAAQQVGSIGLGAYGLSKFMAEGGMAYADGGSVESQDNVQRIVSKLSDQQLQQAAQAAQARGDMDQLEAIQSEMAMRASERNGIAGGVTNEMATRMAGGGILAFDGEDGSYIPEGTADYAGTPNKAALQEWMEAQKALKEYKASPAMTKSERAAMDQENFERFQKFAGADPYAPMAERIKGFSADLEKQGEEGKGLAALQAIPALLRPGSKARAFGGAAAELGSGLGALAKAQTTEKRALASMDFNIADAQRKERMGLTRDAIASTTEAQKDRIAADKAALEALKARAKGATDAGRAFRTTGGAGGAGKGPKLAEQLAAAEIAYKKDPSDANLQTVTGLRLAADRMRTSESGPGKLGVASEANEIKRTKMYEEALGNLKITPEYKKATAEQKKAMEADTRARVMKQPLPSDNAIPVENDYSHLWSNPNQ